MSAREYTQLTGYVAAAFVQYQLPVPPTNFCVLGQTTCPTPCRERDPSAGAAHRPWQRGRRATPARPLRVIRVPSDQTLSLRARRAGGAAARAARRRGRCSRAGLAALCGEVALRLLERTDQGLGQARLQLLQRLHAAQLRAGVGARARLRARVGCGVWAWSCLACWTDASRALAAWRSCSRLGLGLWFG